MYKVNFTQIVKNPENDSWHLSIMTFDLERALALASLLQKISTPEVQFVGIVVEPVK